MADLNFLEQSGAASSVLHEKPITRVGNFTRTFFSAATVIFFVGSIIGVMGLFLWYRFQVTSLQQLLTDKEAIENDLQPELVSRLVFIDTFISQVKGILQAHPFTSNVFLFLERNIHTSAIVNGVTFAQDTKRLDMTIDVPSYLVLSEQVRTFEASPFVERVTFGTPQPNGDFIRFQVSIVLKPSLFGQQSTGS